MPSFPNMMRHLLTSLLNKLTNLPFFYPECDKTLSDLEKERDLFTKWRDQTTAIQETDRDVQEIREPLDEDAESKWRGEY